MPGNDEVERDEQQPRAGDIRTDARGRHENRRADGDLDDPDNGHERGHREGKKVCGQRADVTGPVDQNVEELVDAR